MSTTATGFSRRGSPIFLRARPSVEGLVPLSVFGGVDKHVLLSGLVSGRHGFSLNGCDLEVSRIAPTWPHLHIFPDSIDILGVNYKINFRPV